ncbi:hypothetical protein HMI55_007044 [Coelomomyces lativittatus]|nr:hypothetical protein HMI55_007044 [Coelomomyces lativittatus]
MNRAKTSDGNRGPRPWISSTSSFFLTKVTDDPFQEVGVKAKSHAAWAILDSVANQ